MKKFFKNGLAVLSLVAMLFVTGCSDKKTANLISNVGDNAQAVVLLNPIDVLKSAGATIDGGRLSAPGNIKSILKDAEFLKIKGIDYNLVAVAAYDDAPRSVIFASVKDEDAVISSLKKLDCDKSTIKGNEVFTIDGTAYLLLNNQLIRFNYYSESNLEDYVEEVIDRSQDQLDKWKQDLLLSRSGSTAYGFCDCEDTPIDELGLNFDGCIAFDLTFNGTKASAQVKFVNSKGKDVLISEIVGEDLNTIGDLSKFIYDDAPLSVAWGGIKDESIASLVSKYAGQNASDLDALDDISGIAYNLDFTDPNDFKSIQTTIALSTVSGNAGKALKDLADLAESVGANVSKKGGVYTFSEAGTEGTMQEQGNVVLVKAGDDFSGANPSVADCLAYVGLNVPSDHPLLKQFAKLDIGVKGFLKVTDSVISIEVDLVDSDKPFIQKLIELAEEF